MKHADPAQLERLITGIIKGSRLADKFTRLTLDTGDYDEGGEFIRVLVRMSDLDRISDDDFDALASSIESAVTRYDDRFPSVRFSEP